MQPFYHWFYKNLPVKSYSTDNEVHLLNAEESAKLRTMVSWAVWMAALLGALGVLLLYLPGYLWPHWFAPTSFSFWGHAFSLPLVYILWSILLVFIEIVLLTLLHIYCIHNMAVATGFLRYEHKKENRNTQLLLHLSLEKKDKSVSRYGIDPLAGMNKKALVFWNLLIALKATLSNLAFKFVVQRMLGRYAFQWIQDLAGVPVFALWNAWGTRQVLQQGKVVIMGQNLVEVSIHRIREAWPVLAPYEQLVFSTLQYIAISKRDYHFNHSILTRMLIEAYNIQVPINSYEEKVYLSALAKATPDARALCQWIIALGYLLDGQLSQREKKKLEQLEAIGLAPASWTQMQAWSAAFLNGRGWDGLPLKASLA